IPDKVQILCAPRIRPAQITDGLSHTMVVAELTGRAWERNTMGEGRNVPNGGWADGQNVVTIKGDANKRAINVLGPAGMPMAWEDPTQLYSDHIGGAFALYCDASVHFLQETIEVSILQGLASRDEGEPLPNELSE